MHNLYARFVKILGICKQFSENLIDEFGNIPNLISRRLFNDCRKKPAGLCEELHKRKAIKQPYSHESVIRTQAAKATRSLP